MDVQPASAERAPALDKAFFRKAAWRYPAVIFKNGGTLRSCFYVQANSRHRPTTAAKNTCMAVLGSRSACSNIGIFDYPIFKIGSAVDPGLKTETEKCYFY